MRLTMKAITPVRDRTAAPRFLYGGGVLPRGHLFIVRADITTLHCDAWLVPGDAAGPGESWRQRYAFTDADGPAGVDASERARPLIPREDDRRIPWLVEMSGNADFPIDWYIAGVRAFVARAAKNTARATKRALPLLALPLVGTGGGGARQRAGELTTALVPVLVELAAEHGVDVALCLWSKSQYAAAQQARARVAAASPQVWAALPARLHADAQRLGADANHQLVLFIGAGVSQNAGLPSWDGLLDAIAEELGIDAEQRDDLAEIKDPLARAEAIRAVAGASEPEFKNTVATHIERVSHPSLCHCILASLPVDEAITTNYDRLYEHAAAPHRTTLRVLPYDSVEHGHPWLLKLHGTTKKPDETTSLGSDIVVTRTDYARFDLRWRALASIVETLLVTRHMLFVGFSLADPNFQRMVDTVRRAVTEGATSLRDNGRIGTILEVNPMPYLAQVWSDEFHVVAMGRSRRDAIRDQARLLEVFLDRVASLSFPKSAYLLDPTAVGLLNHDERALKGHIDTFLQGLTEDPRLASLLHQPDAGKTLPALEAVRALFAELGWRDARKLDPRKADARVEQDPD